MKGQPGSLRIPTNEGLFNYLLNNNLYSKGGRGEDGGKFDPSRYHTTFALA